ncbi:aminopeptidase N-like [Euwallacea fornicatus]|uniref:aminopeptidase N-like n=1 Tax=Euwallacea fornicatus TaxID=995702 RepID=UPI00338DAB4D
MVLLELPNMKVLIFLLLVLTTITTAYRLPTTVKPLRYLVHLNLSEAAFTENTDEYEGYVAITLRATQVGVDSIQLHAAHDFINITSVFWDSVSVTDIDIDEATDIATLNLSGNLSLSTAILFITFNSKLSTQDMYGFYKSSYISNGVTKYLATTQFQPTFARRAFPCFDEPIFKANFEIYITYPQGLNALSNMPENAHDTNDIVGDNPNLITTYFPLTNPMPTYLVAFIVSDFTCSGGENIELNAVPYRVCSSKETTAIREFALDTGTSIMRVLNNFTDYNYGSMGFPKMDQVAIPDFAAGAMENWGLVTYREQYLLWNSVESTNGDQQNVATIIAHEYAHQWFGNLVTMEWWSEIFLNEGFATYFEFFATHEVYPKWELDKQYVVKVILPMLETDSLLSAEALQHPAESNGQVLSRFSRVSYYKGGAIFRMVEHILGRDVFIEGLRFYLSQYAFKNTLPEDLWYAFDEQLTDRSRLPKGTNLSVVMENWVINPGFPILEVNSAVYSAIVRQDGRFLLNGNGSEFRWYVPITWATNLNPTFDETAPQDWLEPLGYVEIPFVFNRTQLATWVVLNNHVTGYYRVNYNDLWDPLLIALKDASFSGIPEVNRAQFVDDAFHLARAHRMNYTRVFHIINFLKNDISHHSWLPAINGFNFLFLRVGYDSRLGRAMSSHVLMLLAKIYDNVPWTSLNRSDHAYTLKQVDVLTLACRLGLSNCVNFARERFGEFRITGIRPTQNLRSITYCNALRYGNDTEDWQYLWESYSTTDIASEKVRILQSLGCIANEEILWNYLQLSLDQTSGIRAQDALQVFTSVYSGSSMGIDVAFRFLQENHLIINDRYQSLNALSNMINGLAQRFTTEEQLLALNEFIETGELHEDFHEAASLALATAEANIVWLNEHLDELYAYYGIDPNDPIETTPKSTTVVSTSLKPITTEPPTPDGAFTLSFSVVPLVLSYLALRTL